jgi:hypothetical protein
VSNRPQQGSIGPTSTSSHSSGVPTARDLLATFPQPATVALPGRRRLGVRASGRASKGGAGGPHRDGGPPTSRPRAARGRPIFAFPPSSGTWLDPGTERKGRRGAAHLPTDFSSPTTGAARPADPPASFAVSAPSLATAPRMTANLPSLASPLSTKADRWAAGSGGGDPTHTSVLTAVAAASSTSPCTSATRKALS